MNIKNILLLTLLALTFVITSNTVVAGTIQDRMKARIPEITVLKNKGIVGENNKGYLAYISANKKGTALVNAENADRKQVYENIARKIKSNVEAVGERRAAQIAKNGIKGHWYQNRNGQWSKKQ